MQIWIFKMYYQILAMCIITAPLYILQYVEIILKRYGHQIKHGKHVTSPEVACTTGLYHSRRWVYLSHMLQSIYSFYVI